MVALYQGTVAERLNDFQSARTYYQRVLAIDPNNVSGQYSLADTLFYVSRGDCQPDQQYPQGAKEDADGLREALQRYRQIADKGAAIDTNIRGVVALGMAQVYGCLNQAVILDESGVPYDQAEAEKQFKAAIQFLDKDSSITKDHLAEAHAGLGLIYALSVDNQDSDAAAQWRRSGQEFCSATQLSGYVSRQAEFHHRLAYIHGQLGEYQQAKIERDEAIKLDPESQERYDAWHAQWLEAAKTTPSKAPLWTCEKAGPP
jgi:tetratricopeptide (TPR) repeat protein